MKLTSRITLLFTLGMGLILLFFAFIIYIPAERNRAFEFYELLFLEAETKAKLFFDAKIPAEQLQKIYKNNREIISEVEVAIYSSDFELLYHDASDIDMVKETPELLRSIAEQKRIQFTLENWQVVGLSFYYEGQDYLITAAALDTYGYKKVDFLWKTLIVVLLISLLIIWLTSAFLAKIIVKPLREMQDKAAKISAKELDVRLQINDSKDELAQLAITFNQMLDRLSHAFDSQKAFVSNLAHELRTPLTAMIAELEWAESQKDVALQEQTLSNIRTDAQRLVRVIQSLLDFARADYDRHEIAFTDIRIDELLIDVIQATQQNFPTAVVNFMLKKSKSIEEENLVVFGNEYLLKAALQNLVENACKYSSPPRCDISIKPKKNALILLIKDKGIGIDEDDLPMIFEPFYRGKNQNAQGSGIGLSLSKKIIDLHQGTIQVTSVLEKGSVFKIELPLQS